MNLRDRLHAFKKKFEASASPEIVAMMHRATDDLRRSGIVDRVLKVGDSAPSFALPNAEGVIVRSADLLAKGPLVLSFYRGMW